MADLAGTESQRRNFFLHFYTFTSFTSIFTLLDLYLQIKGISAKPCFWTSEVCRSRRNVRNLSVRFYRLVERVRTLRVPVHRLGALTEEPP